MKLHFSQAPVAAIYGWITAVCTIFSALSEELRPWSMMALLGIIPLAVWRSGVRIDPEEGEVFV